MAASYEKNIRWKAIGIYLFIAVICIAVSYYIYSLSGNVRSQKQHIENYSDLLKITNQVVFSVSDAQSTANAYLNSKNVAHLRAFRRKVTETETLLDSLAYLSRLTGDTTNLSHLMEIGTLLRQKGDIIYRLNTQLSSYNPVDSIEKLFLPDPAEEDTVGILTVVPESFVLPRRANVWERVSGAFTPERPVTDTLQELVTLPEPAGEAEEFPDEPEPGQPLFALPRAIDYMQQIRSGYSSNIRALERQINSLMVTDQEISAQIIEVLNSFHRETIRSTIRHIEDSEDIIQRNYRYSFGGIMLSLLLITFFVILIINDTNKGQRARTELEKANKRISEIMQSRHKLLISVSHDIKTPLNAILGYLELWRQGKNIDGEEVAVAELSGKHINALIGNLLEFSSLEQGISRPSSQPFGLTDFCEETAGIIRPQAGKKGLDLRTSFRFAEGLYVEGDAMRMRQIVLNILSNAVKYTAEGSVVFEASYKNGKITFTVTDTGTGMDAEELGRIFKPFHRMGSNNTMAEGHGFGMFVVRGLVDLLGGEMDIRSTPGEGTAVVVTIPAPLSEKHTPEGSKKILFIDDDTVLLKILSGMASSLGHRVASTSEPGTVVSGEADVTCYDMVITDMEMGRCRGTDVLAAVKSRNPDIPVIVMTGHHDLTARSASEMGFDGYIAKPVSLVALESVAGRAGTAHPVPDGKDDDPVRINITGESTSPEDGDRPIHSGNQPEHISRDARIATPGNAATEKRTTDDGRQSAPATHPKKDEAGNKTSSLPESLTALFGEGEELREIIETFRTATTDDIRTLRSALFRRDYRTARSICHRMLPLFRQFGSEECTVLLERINSNRLEEPPKKDFWKNIGEFIESGSRFIEGL